MTWKKSSHSGQSACVEVRNDLTALRDSKNFDSPPLHTVDIRQLVRFAKTR
jgi:hypothetical protein